MTTVGPMRTPSDQNRGLTLSRLALDLRAEESMREGPFGLRWVAQAITDVRRLTATSDLDRFFAEPPSTGDPRWDALIAGVCERESRLLGRAVPAWASREDRILATWWWLSPVRSLRAYTFTHTPPELAVRGVFVSEESLESV